MWGRVHPSFEQSQPGPRPEWALPSASGARVRYRARWVVPILGQPMEDAFVDERILHRLPQDRDDPPGTVAHARAARRRQRPLRTRAWLRLLE